MSLTGYSFKNPYIIITLSLFLLAGGIFAFFNSPTDLFPDSMAPTLVVLTTWRGSSAENVSVNITQPIENQLKSISGINNIISTTKDEVSSIRADFHYHKDLQKVTAETVNMLDRVKPMLPPDAGSPQVFQITGDTRPLITVALTPKENSAKTLQDIRLFAENELSDYFFDIPGIADVEIFGGHAPSMIIGVDSSRLRQHGMTINDLISSLQSSNITVPAGIIKPGTEEFTITSDMRFASPQDIENTAISRPDSSFVYLKDLASVTFSSREDRSLYRGNGRTAIALNLLKNPEVPTVGIIKEIKNHMDILKNRYKDINFDITTDQQPLIDVNIKGMVNSLIYAVILTVIIIFVFLGRFKTSLITGISIPLSFLSAFIYLYLSPYTLNMVTLSALIIAVGMVVDSSVVILENIIRLSGHKGTGIKQASIQGAREISFAVFAGMMTTVIVLAPVMFTGGYPQTVLKPLGTTIMVTLFFSYLMAVTLVPLLVNRLLSSNRAPGLIERKTNALYTRLEKRIKAFYLGLLDTALEHKIKTLFFTALLTLIIVLVTMNTVGRSVQPPMDTGIANISFEISPNSNIEEMTSLVNRIEREILEEASVLSISTIIGSEPDSMSFSQGGSSVQTASMEIRLLPRNKRKEDIWSITNRWRQSFNRYPELISLTLSEYGATPNSSVKSPVNIIISGRDDIQLSFYADAIIKELDSLKGVVDLRRSWYMARKEYIISPKPLMLEEHNIRFRDIANFIRNSTSEVPAGNIRLESFRDIPVYIKLKDINSPQDVLGLNFYNNLPLRNLINVRQDLSKTLDTRQDLKNTIDLYAVNDIIPISIITRKIEDKIRPVTSNLPSDIKITLGGNVTEMQNTMGRVFSSLLIGLVLLYFLLVIMLKSFSHPLSIMSIIPFSLSGAFLGLLLFNKSVSMPAMMGIILLNGTIVNNAILIVTFINDARKDKKELMPAVKQAVDLRLRPILMTTASTVIGLSPLVFETAVGLERMSPLGIVAASGLIAGTFLTMIIVPVVYVLLEQIKNRL